MTGSLFDKPTDDAPDVETRRRQAVQLSLVPGVGPSKFQRLLDHFGSPGAILNASVLELQEVAQIGPKLARSLVTHATESAAHEELKRAQTAGVSVLVRGLEPYPAQLARIPDPPIVLYVRGTLLPADQLAVAIVGSRHCTTYGRRQAFRLAQSLARAGVTVVSGLARGIDSEAHRGALEAGGRTIAVCATGLETIYPPEHAELALSIIEHGSLVTESPMQQQPKSGLFPQRNRIISGLSLEVATLLNSIVAPTHTKDCPRLVRLPCSKSNRICSTTVFRRARTAAGWSLKILDNDCSLAITDSTSTLPLEVWAARICMRIESRWLCRSSSFFSRSATSRSLTLRILSVASLIRVESRTSWASSSLTAPASFRWFKRSAIAARSSFAFPLMAFFSASANAS